jgi:hypothetical protein
MRLALSLVLCLACSSSAWAVPTLIETGTMYFHGSGTAQAVTPNPDGSEGPVYGTTYVLGSGPGGACLDVDGEFQGSTQPISIASLGGAGVYKVWVCWQNQDDSSFGGRVKIVTNAVENPSTEWSDYICDAEPPADRIYGTNNQGNPQKWKLAVTFTATADFLVRIGNVPGVCQLYVDHIMIERVDDLPPPPEEPELIIDDMPDLYGYGDWSTGAPSSGTAYGGSYSTQTGPNVYNSTAFFVLTAPRGKYRVRIALPHGEVAASVRLQIHYTKQTGDGVGPSGVDGYANATVPIRFTTGGIAVSGANFETVAANINTSGYGIGDGQIIVALRGLGSSPINMADAVAIERYGDYATGQTPSFSFSGASTINFLPNDPDYDTDGDGETDGEEDPPPEDPDPPTDPPGEGDPDPPVVGYEGGVDPQPDDACSCAITLRRVVGGSTGFPSHWSMNNSPLIGAGQSGTSSSLAFTDWPGFPVDAVLQSANVANEHGHAYLSIKWTWYPTNALWETKVPAHSGMLYLKIGRNGFITATWANHNASNGIPGSSQLTFCPPRAIFDSLLENPGGIPVFGGAEPCGNNNVKLGCLYTPTAEARIEAILRLARASLVDGHKDFTGLIPRSADQTFDSVGGGSGGTDGGSGGSGSYDEYQHSNPSERNFTGGTKWDKLFGWVPQSVSEREFSISIPGPSQSSGVPLALPIIVDHAKLQTAMGPMWQKLLDMKQLVRVILKWVICLAGTCYVIHRFQTT